jgi:hypothetical protein
VALVGTTKGLFLLSSDDDRERWRTDGPLLDGWGIYHATMDPRDETMYAATNHRVYGPTVQRSSDHGKTWRRSRHHRRVQATLRYLNGHKHEDKVAPARIASKQLFKRELVHNG